MAHDIPRIARTAWLATGLILPLVAGAAYADVVELKTGQRVNGILKQATPASVSVEVGGQTVTFAGDKVRAIYFGAVAPTATQPDRPREDAMSALKALESVTVAGTTYSEYMRRLGDTKILVDQDVAGLAEPLRVHVEAAMDFYMAAGPIWQAVQRARISRLAARERVDGVTGAIYPFQGECAALKQLQSRHVDAEEVISGAVPAVWSCAADHLAEAEKLLGK